MLKCQFHLHTKGDKEHHFFYSSKEIIDKAAKLNYDALAFTCHRTVIHTKALENYAKKKGIILFSGIEARIEKKEVLLINIDKDAEEIKTFAQLKKYKTNHPNCLIIAPHPFFPGSQTLKNRLIEHIDLFDGIEHSFCYTTTKNFNKKAVEIAKKHHKTLVATADCHHPKDLNIGFCLVESAKNKESIIKAVKSGKIKNVHQPTTYFKIFKTLLYMNYLTLLKKLKKSS